MHYYTFNIGDYASHTKGLSLLEDLAYRRLLDEYYLAERPLNGCSTSVARSIGMRGYEDEVDYVLRNFFTQTPEGGWTNERADREIQHFKTKSAKAAQAGKASAERRLNGRSTDAERTLNERQLTNNQQPITNNQKPNKTKAVVTAPPEGVSSDVWDAFAAIRKARNAPITAVAIAGIQREAQKAGLTLQAALEVACARGWQSFNADWLQGQSARPLVNKQQALEERNRQVLAGWMPPEMRGDDAPI